MKQFDAGAGGSSVGQRRDVPDQQNGHALPAPILTDVSRAATGEDLVEERLSRPAWERRYALAVVIGDLLALGGALLVGNVIGFGDTPQRPYLSLEMSAIIAVGFVVAMTASRAWESKVLGNGSEEWIRLARAVASSSVTLGMVGLAFHVDSVRGWVFLIIPLAGVLAMLGRYALRRPFHRRRQAGRYLHPVLAVGSESFVHDLVERTRRAPHHGWQVAAACVPAGMGETINGVPVVGDLDSASVAARSGDYSVVAVASSDGWTPRRLHQLSWDVEGQGVDLVVAPGLMEVSGPRLHVEPVDGLPLLRLTEPRFTGVPRLLKSAIDIVGAAVLLLILAPVLLLIYFLVRSDGGPGLFFQTRVGKDGRPFHMFKFRTMVPDAERLQAQLMAANDGAGPLFKMRADPRVTPVGTFLRRYSLDELPQIVNVLLGSMSLVGPRPPLPSEVDQYTRDAHRKLLVKPGLTGLWQISGRSDLSWDESVRLDLRYVENWTLALDMLIIWKTFRAVLSGDGAY